MRDEACQENNVQATEGTHKEQDQRSPTAWSLIEEKEKRKNRESCITLFAV